MSKIIETDNQTIVYESLPEFVQTCFNSLRESYSQFLYARLSVDVPDEQLRVTKENLSDYMKIIQVFNSTEALAQQDILFRQMMNDQLTTEILRLHLKLVRENER